MQIIFNLWIWPLAIKKLFEQAKLQICMRTKLQFSSLFIADNLFFTVI